MNARLKFLLGLLLVINGLRAGAQNADSLRKVVETARVDTVKGRTLCRLCQALMSAGDYDGAFAKGREGLALSRRISDPKGEALCLNYIGIGHRNQGRLDSALSILNASLKIYERVKDIDGAANVLAGIGKTYLRQGDGDQALLHLEKALALRRKQGDVHQIGDAYNAIGGACWDLGKFPQALENFQQALIHYRKTSDSVSVGHALNNIGNAASDMGDHAEGLKFHLQGLALREKLGDSATIANSLNGIGVVYLDLGEHEKAIQYYRKSLAIYERLKDERNIAGANINIGISYGYLKKTEQALEHFLKGKEICERLGETYFLANVLGNLGNLSRDLKRYPEALEYHKQALELYQRMGQQSGQASALVNIGILHLSQNQFRKARESAMKGYEMAVASNVLSTKRNALQVVYRSDSALGNWKAAYHALLQFTAHADSLKNDEKSQEIGRLESKAEYERKAERERQRVAEERSVETTRNRWALGSAIGGLAFLGVIAYTLYRNGLRQKRNNLALQALNEEIRQQKAEIEAQNGEIIAQRDQLEQSNHRLLELDRMKEQLTGMIVHDLKNPLNAVLAMAAQPPDENRLTVIRSAGQQMSQLVMNLLDVQKYENAAIELRPETAAANDLIEAALEQTRFLAQRKGLNFELKTEDRLLVNADRNLIERVWVNLLTNAIKYAPAGDTLLIESAYDAARGAVFRLTDHGQGIPAEQLEIVFEKFSQMNGGRASGKLGGTGLGLAFCRLTAEAHGGGVRAISEPGQYTTFEFNLPSARLGDVSAAQPLGTAQRQSPPDELARVYPEVFSRLRELPPYELTAILDLLDQLPDSPESLRQWKARLETAALSGDAEAYRSLLEAGAE